MSEKLTRVTSNRLLTNPAVRNLLNIPAFDTHNLVMVFLVVEKDDVLQTNLPVVTLDTIRSEAKEVFKLGIRGIKLFAHYKNKDHQARGAFDKDSLMMKAIKEIKDSTPEICIITETCLCPYTSNGSCVVSNKNTIDAKSTQEALTNQALLQIEAGANILGPAQMLEGMIKYLRCALDKEGHNDVPLMPHMIFSSSLYDLYRQTMQVDVVGDARGPYHLNPNNVRQNNYYAQKLILEGADMLLIEPAIFVLDIIAKLRDKVDCPISAFSVSGEYEIIANSTQRSNANPASLFLEAFSSLHRAGADFIVTYAAKKLAAILNK